MAVDPSIPTHVPGRTRGRAEFSEGTLPSPLAVAMRAVQTKLGAKAAEQLALITGQDTKSAQRQMAQGRPPNGAAVYSMVRHPVVGPAFIVQATRNLPPTERREFWVRLIVAAGIALEQDIAE